MTTWTSVAKIQDLPPGERKCVSADGMEVVLYNHEGQIFAFENTCPHAGQPLVEGEITGAIIVCPYHGYTFNMASGKNVDYPTDQPLQKYEVRTQDDDIQIQPVVTE